METVVKVVIDTNVLASAMLTPESIYARILLLFRNEKLELYHNGEILKEYESVLNRSKFGFLSVDVLDILSYIRRFGRERNTMKSKIPSFADETDRVFYDTAKASGAYLITGNLRHYPQENFIVSPKEFIAMFESM